MNKLKVTDPGLQNIIDFCEALLAHKGSGPKPEPVHAITYKVKRGPIVMY